MVFDYLYLKIMEISSISAYETVSIEASFTAMTEEGFNCQKRMQDMLDRCKKDGILTPEKEKEIRKCPYLNQELQTNNVTFGKGACLCKCKNPSFSNYLFLYDQLEKGNNPDQGPLLDQPAQIIEICRHIKNLHAQHEEDERKKREKQMKSSNQKHRRR